MTRTLRKSATSFFPAHFHGVSPSGTAGRDSGGERGDALGYRADEYAGRPEVDQANIVRGFEHEKGKYMVLSDKESHAAYAQSAKTVDIVAVIDAPELRPADFEVP